MQHSSVLILGAGGRLGTLLRRVWAARPPTGVQLLYQSRTYLPGDQALLWSPDQPSDQLPVCDCVIALWGITTGDAEALAQNVTLADRARAVALSCGATRLIHLSSAAVYGPAQNASEEAAPAPINPYGQSKLALERQVATYQDPNLIHICLRLANVVGADSLAPALSGSGPVTLDRFANGQGPLRSYISAGDFADTLIALARYRGTLPTVLNVAARTPVAMRDLAQAAGKEIMWRPAPSDAVQHVTMDTTRLARLLPQLSLSADPAALIDCWKRHTGPD